MQLLNEIVIVLGLSTVVVLLCDRIRVPSIIGFLLVGVLAGPSGLGLVTSREEVDTLAEIGVTILAIQRRDGSTVPGPDGSERLLPGDRVVLMGKAEDVRQAALIFLRNPPGEASAP